MTSPSSSVSAHHSASDRGSRQLIVTATMERPISPLFQRPAMTSDVVRWASRLAQNLSVHNGPCRCCSGRRVMAVTEGTVPFRGFRTWYQVVGELPAPDGMLPLLVVSGGPGCAHDYLQDLASLADESGRPVVFYDQLGCGRSDQPDDPALWVMDTFVEEVAAVRAALGLDRQT